MRQFLVFDLGGTFIKYALMNEDCEILSQGKVPSPTSSMEEVLDALKGVADQYQGQYEGVAVSMPGRIDTNKGIAYTGGAYRFIQNAPMEELIRQKLGCNVTIANDGKCAAKAEAARGALKDVEDGAVIVLGSATGGGIVLNHEVRMGVSGGAGELSSLVTDFDTIAENGFRHMSFDGIYAGIASASGLLLEYGKRKGFGMGEIFGGKVSGVSFFEAYDAKEQEAIDSLEQFGLKCAIGIVTIQCVLDLSRFAIGGGISVRKEVTDSIRNGIHKLYHSGHTLPFSEPEIVSCEFRNDANLIGALSFYLSRYQ